MRNDKTGHASVTGGAAHNFAPGSYQFYFLMAACKESMRRFHATPEYQDLVEEYKGRKASELLRAANKLRKDLEPERKFSVFDAETLELLHQRVRARILEKLSKLPPGVYRMKDGTLIVGGNAENATDKAHRSDAEA